MSKKHKLNIQTKKRKTTFSVTLKRLNANEVVAFASYFGYQNISDYIRTALRELNFKHRIEYRQQFLFDSKHPEDSLEKLFLDQQQKLDEFEDLLSSVVENQNETESSYDEFPEPSSDTTDTPLEENDDEDDFEDEEEDSEEDFDFDDDEEED